jgi:hypothetical protein
MSMDLKELLKDSLFIFKNRRFNYKISSFIKVNKIDKIKNERRDNSSKLFNFIFLAKSSNIHKYLSVLPACSV